MSPYASVHMHGRRGAGDELASLHSITSSATASTPGDLALRILTSVRDTLLRTVLSRHVDHLVGNRTTERGAGHGVAPIVNAGPNSRLVGFLGERGKRGGITREKVPEDGGRGGRKAAVRGWIAWMVRCREQWFYVWVELEGANGPVGIFAIPAGDACIQRGDILERVGARRQRRIAVEPVLEDEAADLPAPIVVSTYRRRHTPRNSRQHSFWAYAGR